MLTRLRFKNWRSLKDVEIPDLTPITVFIGANSSGKTNIVDGLYFLREAADSGIDEALYIRDSEDKLRTIGVNETEAIEIEFSFLPGMNREKLTYNFRLQHQQDGFPYSSWIVEQLRGNKIVWMNSSMEKLEATNSAGEEIEEIKLPSDLGLSAFGRTSRFPQIQSSFQYVTQRWQMLDEGFSPQWSVQSGTFADPYSLDRCAHNLPVILETMQTKFPNLFSELESDLQWLLEHTEAVKTEKTESETRFYLEEKYHPQREAPTISAGTGRIAAMLAAYYMLDMRNAEMPGLVVIEEPDTALNPGIHRNFVEQLRNYTSREGYPRQFILTTHNPHFLDCFQPEEVRVVERDEQGYTHVKKIDESISDIWLEEYGLGEVWTTNSFGGLPK